MRVSARDNRAFEGRNEQRNSATLLYTEVLRCAPEGESNTPPSGTRNNAVAALRNTVALITVALRAGSRVPIAGAWYPAAGRRGACCGSGSRGPSSAWPGRVRRGPRRFCEPLVERECDAAGEAQACYRLRSRLRQGEGVDGDGPVAWLEPKAERGRFPGQVVGLLAGEDDGGRIIDLVVSAGLPDQPWAVEGEGAAEWPRRGPAFAASALVTWLSTSEAAGAERGGARRRTR